MQHFLIYHLESSLIIAVFYLFYRLLLRNETFFKTNRIVLLSAIPVAYIIPLIDIPIQSATPVAGIPVVTLPAINLAPATTVQAEAATSTSPLLYLYILGAALLVGHALYGFFSIYRLRRKAQANHNKKQETYYIHKGDSFSFFRMVFLNTENKSENELNQIEAHERVHVEEYHSVDAMLIHLAIIFQWFNPFVWLMKHAIFENHEFIADRETSRNASEYSYQDLLLRQAAGIPLSSLVHPFNKISLKRRFKMLLKNQSPKRNLWKYLTIIPVLTLSVYFVSCSNVEEKDEGTTPDKITTGEFIDGDPVFTVVDEFPRFPGGEKARVEYLLENIKYPKELLDSNIQGTVYVSFIIDKEGKIHDPKVLRGVHEKLDAISIEAVENMPDWSPGKREGEAVNLKFNMPIRFTLNADKPEKPEKPDQVTDNSEAFVLVDERPEFKGGEEAWMEYMSEHIDYPEDAKEKGLEGTVYVQFVVEKDGSISNVKLLRGFYESCDQEALETIRNMPDWKPGKKDGKPVRTQFNMPIKFTLDN
ncbi:MAG TPA: M56 family metallopeptidase [Bacteroidales bacterium]|nr:M56 family metallopeptidase [Bacteroidales bacterium]